MPRSEEANLKIREERKQAILEAAMRVFARQGLTDSRIADIAAESQMSQGLIYRYFESKEEVFTTLVEGTFQLTLALAHEAAGRPEPALARLRWLATRLLPYQYEQPGGALMLLHAVVNNAVPANVRQMALSYSLQVQRIVTRLIIEGQSEGQIINRDPERLMIMFLAAFQGLAASTMFVDRENSRFPDVDIIMSFLDHKIK